MLGGMNTDTAASVALAALTLYALVAIVGRSLLHRRRTGSSGWRGVHGRPGSAPWWGGVLLGLACVGFIAAPIVAIGAEPGIVDTVRLWAGGILFVVGGAITVVAQAQMGDAWRIGVDARERTCLRTSGLFAWCRNPVFTGMILAGLAMVAWVPVALLAWIALVLGIELQVRAVEEPYLLSVHGATYRSYAGRTGRFFPGVGRGLRS